MQMVLQVCVCVWIAVSQVYQIMVMRELYCEGQSVVSAFALFDRVGAIVHLSASTKPSYPLRRFNTQLLAKPANRMLVSSLGDLHNSVIASILQSNAVSIALMCGTSKAVGYYTTGACLLTGDVGCSWSTLPGTPCLSFAVLNASAAASPCYTSCLPSAS